MSGLTVLSVCAVAVSFAQQTSVPQIVEGTAAAHDYAAPTDFAVVDVAATVANAASAGARLPVVVRTDADAANAVVAEFDAAFHTTRAAYLDALEAAFGRRVLGRKELETPRFRSFRSEFQAANSEFPASQLLAQTWATGGDGEETRDRLASVLRVTMTGRLIGDIRPASTVYVAALEPADRIRTWSEASAHARAVDHGDIVRLETAGQTMRQLLDVLDRGAGGFLAGLLRANVVTDDYLTGLLLHERLGTGAQARVYRRGEPIVSAGHVVDHAAAQALAQLTRMGLEPLDSAIAQTPFPPVAVEVAPAAVAPETPETKYIHRRRWLLVFGGTLGALALGGVALLWSARRHRRLQPPTQWLEQTGVLPPAGVREALLPHLARELKNRLVHALFAQRQELLKNEAAATQRVADLEARLAKLQPAIAEKIRSYEQRIRSLETEIEEKDQETRDLLRAKLVLARKELDAEISRQQIRWN